MNDKIEDRIKDFVRRRAERLGISVDAAHLEGKTKPEFLKAAEQLAARQGLTTEQVLERDLERLHRPPFPAMDCLMPYEIAQYQETGALDPERQSHVERCVTCETLLTSRPDVEWLTKYKAVVAGRSRRSQGTRLKDLVIPWLAKPAWDPQQLVSWLQQAITPSSPNPPPDQSSREVLKALRQDPERERWELQLAQRVAQLLALSAESNGVQPFDRQLLFNLFHICAGLARPAELGEVLNAMWRKQSVSGSWENEDLRRLLLLALIENQTDRRLQPLWEDLVQGKSNEGVPGTVRDGFRGILRMPQGGASESDLSLIGCALTRMLQTLPEGASQHSGLEELLSQTKRARQRASWDYDLIELADQNQWPAWAVQRLNLFVHRGSTFWLWKPMAYVVRSGFPTAVLNRLCAGEVFRVELPDEAVTFIHQIARPAERRRLGWVRPDPRGCRVECANDLHESSELFHKANGAMARAMLVSADEILAEEKVGSTSI